MHKSKLDLKLVPEIILDERPELIELYQLAWQLAWNNVKEYDGVPVSPLMKEGFAHDRLWIWDTCLMAHFCKFAPDLFPGIQSLDNFYAPMHDQIPTSMRIHHPDNPPLFAWTELEYYRISGDRKRLEHIFLDRKYLQKHYHFMETLDSGYVHPVGIMHCNFKKLPDGYMWSGNPNGMDNTPRGYGNYDAMLWLDAAAQQALSALYISRIASMLNQDAEADEYMARYNQLKTLLNTLYWDDQDGTYYDIMICNRNPLRVLTPASFWPMLAEIPDKAQAERMTEALTDPDRLGGIVPCPSVARNSEFFRPEGAYWRGAVWLPTSYMVLKSLGKYGYHALASELALKTIDHMYATWKSFSPHTIWECYSPCKPEASTAKKGELVRPDFCGWSALGPISMMIENVIGISRIDASENCVCWRPRPSGRNGIKNLQMGKNRISLIADGAGNAAISCLYPFKLQIFDRELDCPAGDSSIEL